MKISVLPRIFFEKIKGTAEEDRLLDHYRIISINSSRGDDSLPPFSERNWNHRNLLCLTFDDVCNEPDPEDHDDCALFSTRQAEAVMRFADDGSTPMLIHCTAGISRSGAVGEILDWYFNRYVADNPADHLFFTQNNRQILANPLVRKVFLDHLNPINGADRK